MATRDDNLQTAIDNVCADLATVTNPTLRKATYSVGGVQVPWNDYRRMLTDELEQLLKLASQIKPFESRTIVL